MKAILLDIHICINSKENFIDVFLKLKVEKVAEDRKIKKHISFVWKALMEHYFKAQFKLLIQITKRRNQISVQCIYDISILQGTSNIETSNQFRE